MSLGRSACAMRASAGTRRAMPGSSSIAWSELGAARGIPGHQPGVGRRVHVRFARGAPRDPEPASSRAVRWTCSRRQPRSGPRWRPEDRRHHGRRAGRRNPALALRPTSGSRVCGTASQPTAEGDRGDGKLRTMSREPHAARSTSWSTTSPVNEEGRRHAASRGLDPALFVAGPVRDGRVRGEGALDRVRETIRRASACTRCSSSIVR
jgi:hypothetical protein